MVDGSDSGKQPVAHIFSCCFISRQKKWRNPPPHHPPTTRNRCGPNCGRCLFFSFVSQINCKFNSLADATDILIGLCVPVHEMSRHTFNANRGDCGEQNNANAHGPLRPFRKPSPCLLRNQTQRNLIHEHALPVHHPRNSSSPQACHAKK